MGSLDAGAGVLAGSVVAPFIGIGPARGYVLLLAADAIMPVVGVAACAAPVRRALRIKPIEELRAEG